MRHGIGVIALLLATGASATTIYETGFDAFAGKGFVAGGAPGALDSVRWRAGGLSDGDGEFGDGRTTGDFARGLATGAVGAGGIYAFLVSPDNRALGLQATGADLTPGFVDLLVLNDTGSPLTSIDLGYRLWTRNDGSRASAVTVAVQHASGLIVLDDLSAVTPGTADRGARWIGRDLGATVAGLGVAAGDSLSVRWTFDDLAGRGSRDELAIDDIVVRARSQPPLPAAVPEPATTALLTLGALVAIRKRRAGPRIKVLRQVNVW